MSKELYEIFSGNYEVELTDEVIDHIIEKNLWEDKESLINLRDYGAKWNTKRNSIIMDMDYFDNL